MFYIYILYSRIADKFYVGHKDDVQRRLCEHNNQIVKSKFTAKYVPWEIILSFPVSDKRSEAIRVEKFISNRKAENIFLD
jgi:putative endonuclease